MRFEPTEYYDEFLRYCSMAFWQHHNCNLGDIPHELSPFDDDLMKHVHLYDVVERKYAGFSQLLLDLWHSKQNHPYRHKLTKHRLNIINYIDTTGWADEEWFFVFFVHRLTGSGINYGLENSGYHNSVLLAFNDCETIEDMVEAIKYYRGPKYTSKGYQIAPFPKPKLDYERGGDYFMCEVLPDLVRKFYSYIMDSSRILTFREMMQWLEKYNKDLGFRVFRFQYAAVLADIADFFPDEIDTGSHFFYGKNAEECLNYLFVKPKGVGQLEFLDGITEQIRTDTGLLPYNSEDVACDFIRWVENYIDPRGHYSHLDLDKVWSSHRIENHPYGRQKKMLELGLVDTFNGMPHPSDDKILKQANMSIEEYVNAK